MHNHPNTPAACSLEDLTGEETSSGASNRVCANLDQIDKNVPTLAAILRQGLDPKTSAAARVALYRELRATLDIIEPLLTTK